MPEVPIRLMHGDQFRLLTSARVIGDLVLGLLDFPPYPHLGFADHMPGNPFFPGVMKLSAMFQLVQTFCAEATQGKLFPILTGIPLVRFYKVTKPGEVTVQANVFQDGYGGVATCTVNANSKERASAIFTFDMSTTRPPETILPLPLEQINIKMAQGLISGVFNYKGNEVLPLAHLEVIPFPLVLEALCQNTIQVGYNIASLANALFVVTYPRDTVFHGTASKGMLNLRSKVEWTEKRGLVHAVASCGEWQPIVSGDFGFAILNPKH